MEFNYAVSRDRQEMQQQFGKGNVEHEGRPGGKAGLWPGGNGLGGCGHGELYHFIAAQACGLLEDRAAVPRAEGQEHGIHPHAARERGDRFREGRIVRVQRQRGAVPASDLDVRSK